MKDFRLTQLPNGRLDLLLVDGKTQFVEDGEQAVQHAVMRLIKIKGESVTDNENEEGTDYYGIIFNVMKSRAEKELHLKKRILGTPGIRKFVSFEWNQTRHKVEIKAFVETQWGTTHALGATLEPF